MKKKITLEDFVKWGAAGGRKSKRTLTSKQARAMVAAKLKKGKKI